jgi:hypothetical protein
VGLGEHIATIVRLSRLNTNPIRVFWFLVVTTTAPTVIAPIQGNHGCDDGR